MNNQNRNRQALLQQLNEVSFAAYDTLLYLDTHQNDQAALEYYRNAVSKRREAMGEYTRLYGPLTIDCASATENDQWQWAQTPWPWEGGAC